MLLSEVKEQYWFTELGTVFFRRTEAEKRYTKMEQRKKQSTDIFVCSYKKGKMEGCNSVAENQS